MSTYKNLMTVCAAVVLAFGLAACGSSDDDTAEAPVMEMPEPVPEPDPGPTDLEETQTAAAAAAAAAMTASDNAAESASSAADATMTLATLQTGDDSNSDAMGGREAAYGGRCSRRRTRRMRRARPRMLPQQRRRRRPAMRRKTAWSDAGGSPRSCQSVQRDDSLPHMADAAIAAAMTELHIDGTVKSVGDSSGRRRPRSPALSSIDADMGMLTTTCPTMAFRDDHSRTTS